MLQSACIGTPATFATVATGSSPFSYQWRKNGAPIPGATAASYTIPAVQNGDAGLYSVTVDNACGSVTTAQTSSGVEVAQTDHAGQSTHQTPKVESTKQ